MDQDDIKTYQLGVTQSSAYRSLNKLFSTLLKPHGLTSMQWFVLGTIYDGETDGIQLSQLSAKLQTGLPFITNTINLLESKGMVERRNSPTDSRSKQVTITETFRPTCQSIESDLRQQLQRSLYAAITPEDFQVYMKALARISELGVKHSDNRGKTAA